MMCGGLEKGLVCRRLLLFILLTFSISWLAAFGGEWLFPDTEAELAGVTVTEGFLCNIIILLVFAGISLWVLLRKQ